MIVYSTAFALPFVVLAIAPRLVTGLPSRRSVDPDYSRPDWNPRSRCRYQIRLDTDMVLRWGVFTRPVVLFGWTVLAIVGAAYLGRNLRTKLGRGELRPVGFVPVMIALFLAAWLGSGLTGRPLRQIEAFFLHRHPSRHSRPAVARCLHGC